ncbi:GntR family transcriptional regulator [Nocardia sp. NPDC019395]|uniref:GntR family transcriptional regulator n=1 Tax=Nocardia sp. NPDC019395 TaxID=3154686 RepID=UPI0033DD637D
MPTSRASELTRNAAEEIRRWVLDGAIEPGERLREVDVAARLGMSRTPVRQAFQLLSGEGILDARPAGGFEVPQWSWEEIDEIYQLRAVLESFAARRAAKRCEQVPIAVLADLATEMTRIGETEEPDRHLLGELNLRFHNLVFEAAGSPRLVAALTSVTHVPLVHRIFFVYTRTEMEKTLQEHHLLVDALNAGDPDWAAGVQQAHILAARSVLLNRLAGQDQRTPATGPSFRATTNEELL